MECNICKEEKNEIFILEEIEGLFEYCRSCLTKKRMVLWSNLI